MGDGGRYRDLYYDNEVELYCLKYFSSLKVVQVVIVPLESHPHFSQNSLRLLVIKTHQKNTY